MDFLDITTGEIIVKPLVRTKFNYDMNRASLESALVGKDPDDEGYDGKTQQNFKEECDINTIVNNFLKTGQIPENHRMPEYMDVNGVFNLQTAMNTMMEAEASFMALPAKIRAEFENDPMQFLGFIADEKNKPRLHEMGLLRPDYEAPAPAAPAPGAPAPAPAPAGTSTAT